MNGFEHFKSVHGPGMDCRKVSEETIARYNNLLPAALLEHWRVSGWCSYADGLLWVIDPEELNDPLAEWLGTDAVDAYAIVRTAFGDIIYWNGEALFYLDIREGIVTELGRNVEVLFYYTLCKNEYLDAVIDRKLFRQALPLLGKPEADECYAFVPAVQLGGPGTLESLQRVKTREHLSILAQLRS